MYNLVVYGSLLNKNELKKHKINLEKIDFVKVYGFKRVFNQEPSWRIIKSSERAVLNIIEDKNSWFNAIVVKDLDEKYIKDLDIREKGYDRINLKKEFVIPYDDKTELKNCIVYKGKKEKQNDKILPNQDYCKICIDGAKSHFEEFYQDFMATTYKNSPDGSLENISA